MAYIAHLSTCIENIYEIIDDSKNIILIKSKDKIATANWTEINSHLTHKQWDNTFVSFHRVKEQMNKCCFKNDNEKK